MCIQASSCSSEPSACIYCMQHGTWAALCRVQYSLTVKAAQWQICNCVESEDMSMRLCAAILGHVQQAFSMHVLVRSQVARMETHAATAGATGDALLRLINAHARVAERRV